MKYAEEQVLELATILGRTQPDSLGGGLEGFIYDAGNGKTLTFGYASGPLGWSLDDDNGNNFGCGEMEDLYASAKSQAKWIKGILEKMGVKS